MPRVLAMAKLNREINIQKAGILRIGLTDEKLGASPKKSPPLPKRANTNPIAIELVPTKRKTLLQANQ